MSSLKETVVLKVDPRCPDRRFILRAARIIRSGGLVVFPTETVYGIAANFLDEQAIKKLYEVKARPKGKPFTVHISDIKAVKKLGCAVTPEARALLKKFWPGPLTVILRSETGNKTGFRMPASKVALELIRAAGVPVVAPSANISGNRPPKSAAEAMKDLMGRVDVVLDGGRTSIGVESTIVDLTVSPPVILREGAIKSKEIFEAIWAI